MIDATDRPTDQPTELLDRQRALQAEAGQVRARLDLGRVLGSVGDPVVVGSAAMGLMTWRDLDITIVCPSLDRRQVLGIATGLAGNQDVKAMQYRNDTGRWNQEPEKYPDGLYLGLCYHPSELPEWKLDLWFVDDPVRQPDLGHLRTLPERLTDDARLAICSSRRRGAPDRSTGHRCAAGIFTRLCSTMAFAAPTSSTGGSPASYRAVHGLTAQPCPL